MNISITTEPLREALAAVARVAQNKSPVEIMSAVLVYSEDQDIKVAATSMYGDIIVETGVVAKQDFRFAVSAERLRMIVDRADAKEVKFALPDDNSQVGINGGRAKGRLKLLPAADFPAIREPDGDVMFEGEFNVADGIAQMLWACAIGAHHKTLLQGVSIIVEPEGKSHRMRLFSASGVAGCTLDIADPALEVSKPGYVTIPMPSAKLLAQVFKDAGVRAYRSRLVVEAAGFRMSVPLLETGETMPLRMPPVTGNTLRLGRGQLLDAIRSCASMVDAKLVVVGAKETAGEAEGAAVVRISGTGSGGDFETAIPTIDTEGSNLDCHFNAAQMVPALSSCASDIITIIVPQGKDAAHKAHRIVGGLWEATIMPVKV